jgi:hypothetical protein
MKKVSSTLVVVCLFASAVAQNWTTVSASNITDLNQNKLAAGQLCFLGTDQNDNPISFNIGGGGQSLRRAYCASVVNGVAGSVTVPNPQFTAPSGIYYRVTAKDSSTGQEVLRYTQVTFTGGTFNFDNYAPTNLGMFAPLSGNSVVGNLSVSGNITTTGSVFGANIPNTFITTIANAGSALTQRSTLNFFGGITCADNSGNSRTDCQLGTHNLLSSSHGDTTAASAVRGDGLFAIGATPTWQRLAHSSATGGYFKWNGTDIVASTGAAAGAGSCTNQAVTATNADATPTCTTLTSAYVDSSIAKTGTDINTSNQVTQSHLDSEIQTKAPRYLWYTYVGAFSAFCCWGSFTPDKAITVTRMDAQFLTGATCTVQPTITVSDGTNVITLTVPNTVGTATATFSQNYAAGTLLRTGSTAGTCSVAPGITTINVQYKMQ